MSLLSLYYNLFSLFNNEKENASQNEELRQRPASTNSLLDF